MQCLICGGTYLCVTHLHLLKKHGVTIKRYLEQYPGACLTSTESSNRMSQAQKGKKMGDDNPARRKEVKEKIRNSVSKLWDEGLYKDRVNGMTGMCGELHPSYDPEKQTPQFLAEHKYKEFLAKYDDIDVCQRCGVRRPKRLINIHHVDEDRTNFLPSNLEPLCVPCHTSYHYDLQKLPFIEIAKRFSFAAAHRLPEYDGACGNWHGHEWCLWVHLRKRINTKTGMVLDFTIIKKIVNDRILSLFDHSSLNDYIQNPTAENILLRIWEILMFDAHLKGIEKLILYETPSSEAVLTKEGMLSILTSNMEHYVEEREE